MQIAVTQAVDGELAAAHRLEQFGIAGFERVECANAPAIAALWCRRHGPKQCSSGRSFLRNLRPAMQVGNTGAQWPPLHGLPLVLARFVTENTELIGRIEGEFGTEHRTLAGIGFVVKLDPKNGS